MHLSSTTRPPIVAVMGHIDHGKSTLLDYIRNTQIVAGEAGGITQGISAYEVEHEHNGTHKRITFIDTPGHEAFQEMRVRGGAVADIAILVVSAEDGVKPQTLDAYHAITSAKTACVVAINKIDKPNADVERTKASLLEHGIYLEGLGGDIPYAAISAKTGAGVDELLDLVLLVAELQELTTDQSAPPEGVIIEAHRDPKIGIAATAIVTNGTLSLGGFIVAGGTYAPIRTLEDCHGNKVSSASAATPIRITGFSGIPPSGTRFEVVANKRDAEARTEALKQKSEYEHIVIGDETAARVTIPVLIKVNAFGAQDAIIHELKKHVDERVTLRIVSADVGTISEGDVKRMSAFENAIIAGFNVNIDPAAQELAERHHIEIKTFAIIYELADWLTEAIRARIPSQSISAITGRAVVLKIFSTTKQKQVLGARVLEGVVSQKNHFTIYRNETEVGTGTVVMLQQSKVEVATVAKGLEFGAQIVSDVSLAAGDELVCIQNTVS